MGNCIVFRQTNSVVTQAATTSHRPNTPARQHRHEQRKHQDGDKMVASGMKMDFGYDKNFGERYVLGKLLGHGQFGYTFVGTDKINGDRVAVKRIDKNKVS